MGSNGSKTGQFQDEISEGSVPSTPILTNKIVQNYELDPRSPTANISRTPIMFSTPGKDGLDFDSVDCDSNPLTGNSDKILLGIDPRSPTAEFNRTPIIINAADQNIPKRLYNKTLENVRKSGVITTPLKSMSLTNVPPKLLDSSPITTRPELNKRKSFVGLLETNLDFTETDLDAVIKSKSLNNSFEIKELSPLENKMINIVESKNADPRSPTLEFLRTPIQIVKKIGEIELNNTVEEIIPVPDVKTSEDEVLQEVLPEKATENQLEEEEIPEELEVDVKNVPEEVLENEIEIKTPPPATKVDQTFNTDEKFSINITQEVKAFDQKLTNLIYEDDDNIVTCPRITAIKESNRTPLGVRNVRSEPKKSSQKLKVSDKPRKSDYVVSKIPVYKEKNYSDKIQCENTPPRNMEKKRLIKGGKKSHWDADNTLVI